MADTMRAVVIREHGDVDALRLERQPIPEPGAGEVRVRVRAVGLNHLDVWVRRGVPGHAFPLPLVPGSDVAGEVDVVGDRVDDLEPGAPVVLSPGRSCGVCRPCLSGRNSLCRRYGILGETVDGGCRDYLVAPRASVFPKPGNLTFPEAAAVPLAFLTAWHMVVDRAALRPGERVLVHAAGSGVSSAAIQIARLWGGRVFATAGSDEKLALARELGAEATFNYREGAFAPAVRAWTEKRGVDVAIDHVGADTFDATLKTLAKGGRYVTCGSTSGFRLETDFRLVFFKSLSILGSTMGGDHELAEVLEHVARGELRPIVDRVLPLDAVGEAHRHLESRGAIGKTVLELG